MNDISKIINELLQQRDLNNTYKADIILEDDVKIYMLITDLDCSNIRGIKLGIEPIICGKWISIDVKKIKELKIPYLNLKK